MLNLEEVATCGPDMIGLVFVPESPRYAAKSLLPVQVQHLPDSISRVGVFVDTPVSQVCELVREFHLTAVQLHGDESLETCASIKKSCHGVSLLKAFALSGEKESDARVFARSESFGPFCEYFLFDASGPARGGNGITFDWSTLAEYRGTTPFLLAGGITPENVGEAMKVVAAHPLGAGIDVSSGVENSPGVKSAQKTAKLIQAVRGFKQ